MQQKMSQTKAVNNINMELVEPEKLVGVEAELIVEELQQIRSRKISSKRENIK